MGVPTARTLHACSLVGCHLQFPDGTSTHTVSHPETSAATRPVTLLKHFIPSPLLDLPLGAVPQSDPHMHLYPSQTPIPNSPKCWRTAMSPPHASCPYLCSPLPIFCWPRSPCIWFLSALKQEIIHHFVCNCITPRTLEV